MTLTRNCHEFADVLNIRIFKQISVFLRELSNDNEYMKSVDLSAFAPIVENEEILPVTPDNVDFFWNLFEFHFNVTVQKEGSIGIFSRLDFYASKMS